MHSTSPVHPFSLNLSTRKGGSGKTSSTVNIAAIAAQSGYRTLVIDTDPQGNTTTELLDGSSHDHGRHLTDAITGHAVLEPVVTSRERLHLLAGGRVLEEIAYGTPDEVAAQTTGLRDALVAVHDDYDLIVIDQPPLVRTLREIGLAASRFLVIPTRADSASVDGVAGVAADFERVLVHNPDLELLGVILFGVGTSSKSIRSAVRNTISSGLGTIAPVFETVIRYAEAPAIGAREQSLAVHEDAAQFAESAKFTERKKAVTANKLAGDYIELTTEILTAMQERLSATPAHRLDAAGGA